MSTAQDIERLRGAIKRVAILSETLGNEPWYGTEPGKAVMVSPFGCGKADFEYIAACSPDAIAHILDSHARLLEALTEVMASGKEVTESNDFTASLVRFGRAQEAARAAIKSATEDAA